MLSKEMVLISRKSKCTCCGGADADDEFVVGGGVDGVAELIFWIVSPLTIDIMSAFNMMNIDFYAVLTMLSLSQQRFWQKWTKRDSMKKHEKKPWK